MPLTLITPTPSGGILSGGKLRARGGLVQAFETGKIITHLMEECHHLVTADPTLSSFHSSIGFLVDKDPHATGNEEQKPALDAPRMSNLILVF